MKVDRPLGRRHPRWSDLIYAVNYGELPGTPSRAGQIVDAYLLVWGEVIAVLVRTNDQEDNLEVARSGTVWTDKEIMQAVLFPKRFFQTSLRR
ncbi:hypothetical protein DEDE109153_03490 [Deinococcus deserti]|uniref:hypothetical protein n=1 Tax=Deinococcus deserti TaxID=310783 RepID=UPI00059E5D18|nr:hypothetical protein [Deinococcus deserti]